MNAFIDFLITPAYADTATVTNPQGGGMSFMIMFIVFFAFMYFGIWRPQTKRAKEQRQLMDSLNKGDEIVTTAGVLGKINKIVDQHIIVTIANGVDIVMQKSAIVSILPKGTLKALE